MSCTAQHTSHYENFVVQSLTCPVLVRSNPHGQHTAVNGSILRSPNLANAKINNLRHLFSPVNPAYALTTHPHGESGLVTSDSLAHTPRFHAVFLCVHFSSFSYAPVMVWLNGEAFAPASDLENLLTNPVQSNHPHLVMSGSTSIHSLGVTPMTNTAQNPSIQTANSAQFTLHNPTDRTAASYIFDSLEAAQAFKQQHCLSPYRIAYVELFAVESGGVFA